MNLLNRNRGGSKKEMSFIDHLEVLRWHLIRAVIAILIAAILIGIFSFQVANRIILGPAHNDFITYKWLCKVSAVFHLGNSLCFENMKVSFISTGMTEQFMSTFTIAFVGGFIVASPYIFWELWQFIKPALTRKEVKGTRGAIFWVSFLFLLGVLFGYFVLTPFMVNFYFSYSLSPLIEIKPTFSDYLENLIYTTAGIGLLFQMPLLVWVLAKIGIVQASFLKKYRRHAFVLILIAAAIITPSTDPFSLTIVAIPLYLLFEASIIIAQKINKAEEKEIWE
jgi:sec-independent protein translocase protein TatC